VLDKIPLGLRERGAPVSLSCGVTELLGLPCMSAIESVAVSAVHVVEMITN
jgi:hypothetical protein